MTRYRDRVSSTLIPPAEFVSIKAFCADVGFSNSPDCCRLIVDDTESPVKQGIPKSFVAPINEWYSWRPSPRLDKNVRVLLTLDRAHYSLGIKRLITDEDPDVPVVWTNPKYRMLYMNMGHGDKIFTTSTQNRLFENGILWLLSQSLV